VPRSPSRPPPAEPAALAVTGGGNLPFGSSDILSLTSTQTGSFTIAAVTGGGTESGPFGTVILNGKNEVAATIMGTPPDQSYMYPDLAIKYNTANAANELANVMVTSGVPEPTSLGLMAFGAMVLLRRGRRRVASEDALA
jgi:hypothetical protein